jgi:uncharacterized protein YbaP (TraB family)
MPQKICLSLISLALLILCLPSISQAEEPVTKKNPKDKYKEKKDDNAEAAKEGEEGKETGKLFLWKITSNKTEIHVLGTIHMAKKGFYPLDPAIEKAYKVSDNLVVELDVSDPNVAMQAQLLTLTKGMYQNGGSIENILDPMELTRLKKILPAEVPYMMAKMLKPWLLGQTIQLFAMKKMGYDETLGIDKHFLDQAKKDKKKILSLETVDDQISAISGGSPAEAKAAFKDGLKDFDKLEESMESIFDLWKKGDAETLYKLMVTEPQKEKKYYKDFLKRLNTDRNLKMVEKMDAYLKSDETYLVAIGTLHTLGKEGVIELLKKKGHKVERVSKTKKAAGAK